MRLGSMPEGAPRATPKGADPKGRCSKGCHSKGCRSNLAGIATPFGADRFQTPRRRNRCRGADAALPETRPASCALRRGRFASENPVRSRSPRRPRLPAARATDQRRSRPACRWCFGSAARHHHRSRPPNEKPGNEEPAGENPGSEEPGSKKPGSEKPAAADFCAWRCTCRLSCLRSVRCSGRDMRNPRSLDALIVT